PEPDADVGRCVDVRLDVLPLVEAGGESRTRTLVVKIAERGRRVGVQEQTARGLTLVEDGGTVDADTRRGRRVRLERDFLDLHPDPRGVARVRDRRGENPTQRKG